MQDQTGPAQRSWATAPVLALTLALTACAASTRPAVTPDERPFEQLATADALVRAGCLDCLLEAYRRYDTLREVPRAHADAVVGAVRTAALVAIRERELGAADTGHAAHARELVTAAGDQRPALEMLLEIADTLPGRGPVDPVVDDLDLSRRHVAYGRRDAYLARLAAQADDDPLSAYLWMGFNCAYGFQVDDTVADLATRLPRWRDTPLLTFRSATCRGYDAPALEGLLAADPRFVEANYFLGLRAMLDGRFDDSLAHLQRAYGWRSRWPAVTGSLASAHFTLEEFDRAVEYFDRTLAVSPSVPDALLGKARALAYLGRHRESIAALDQLLALERWYIGDARYWRAFNEAQLGEYEAAWADVELAAPLLFNAEVPKLAGIIAYRRRQPDVARAKFEESRGRNPDDCETRFYLGLVLSEQQAWSPAADVLTGTASCLERADEELRKDIERIRGSSDPAERRARQIARREQQIASGKRMLTTCRFNGAVAAYRLGRTDEARRLAERIVDDEQFGSRARALLARLH